jgi:hypothetical protein
LKEDEAPDPETTTVKGNPPADESLPDSIPPESLAAREVRALDPEPPTAGLVVLAPSSGSVEIFETEHIPVLSPLLTRGRKTNKARREKEAASNISLGSQK